MKPPLRILLCSFLLFAFSCSTQPNQSQLPDPVQAGWKGAKVCDVLFENEHIRVLRCSFPPDGGHDRHYHPPHFGYVLSDGRMNITDATGTRTVDLSAGATWYSEGVEWHEVENVGGTLSEYLIVEEK